MELFICYIRISKYGPHRLFGTFNHGFEYTVNMWATWGGGLNFHSILYPFAANRLSILSWSMTSTSSRNSRSAPVKFVPLSETTYFGVSLLATIRVNAWIKESVSKEYDITKCTARVTRQVNKQRSHFTLVFFFFFGVWQPAMKRCIQPGMDIRRW